MRWNLFKGKELHSQRLIALILFTLMQKFEPMTHTRNLLWAACLLFPLSLMAQEPALNRVQAMPDADDTELFIKEFHRVMNLIANDFPNDFKNIKGPVIMDDGEATSNFSTSAALPEASEAYITTRLEADFSTVNTVYVAVFFDGIDGETADVIYSNLVWLINNCSFECCNMVYDELDDSADSGAKTTFYLPYDSNNTEAYENMLFEVRLFKSFDLTDDLELIDTWMVVLNVSTFVE